MADINGMKDTGNLAELAKMFDKNKDMKDMMRVISARNIRQTIADGNEVEFKKNLQAFDPKADSLHELMLVSTSSSCLLLSFSSTRFTISRLT